MCTYVCVMTKTNLSRLRQNKKKGKKSSNIKYYLISIKTRAPGYRIIKLYLISFPSYADLRRRRCTSYSYLNCHLFFCSLVSKCTKFSPQCLLFQVPYGHPFVIGQNSDLAVVQL